MKHRLRFLWLAVAVIQAAWPALAAAQPGVPRSEHPRPDRARAEWLTLNGPWAFEFDDDDRGLAERWYQHLRTDRSRIPRNGREALAFGYKYGTPILMTEFGGIAYRIDKPAAPNEWGYSGIEPTKEAFLARLDGLVKALRANPVFAGFCYTQLTDVEQEINGLLTYDRRPKADLAELAKIIGQDSTRSRPS